MSDATLKKDDNSSFKISSRLLSNSAEDTIWQYYSTTACMQNTESGFSGLSRTFYMHFPGLSRTNYVYFPSLFRIV